MTYVLRRSHVRHSKGLWMVDGPGSPVIIKGHQDLGFDDRNLFGAQHRFCLQRLHDGWHITEMTSHVYELQTPWLQDQSLNVGFVTRRQALARLTDALETSS